MYSYWIESERFYTLTMPGLVLVLLVLLISYILLYSYTEKGKTKRKYTNRSFFAIVIFSVIYFGVGHLNYQEWLTQNESVHPGIREYSMVLGMQVDEDASLVRHYRQSEELSNRLSELEMYEPEEVSQSFPYAYIGSNDTNHYFEFGDEDDYVFRMQGDIQWGSENSEIAGLRYRLVDERFESIGFYNDHDIIFESLALPDEEPIELEQSNQPYDYSITELYSHWNFGRQFY